MNSAQQGRLQSGPVIRERAPARMLATAREQFLTAGTVAQGRMRDASPPLLLLALDKTAAGQIRQELTGPTQFALVQEYLRACRRGHGIVFAQGRSATRDSGSAENLIDPDHVLSSPPRPAVRGREVAQR
jgi:hypothetical protein